jgi:hypothetical protein
MLPSATGDPDIPERLRSLSQFPARLSLFPAVNSDPPQGRRLSDTIRRAPRVSQWQPYPCAPRPQSRKRVWGPPREPFQCVVAELARKEAPRLRTDNNPRQEKSSRGLGKPNRIAASRLSGRSGQLCNKCGGSPTVGGPAIPADRRSGQLSTEIGCDSPDRAPFPRAAPHRPEAPKRLQTARTRAL